MKKTYPEQLGEWIKQRKSTQRDKNLVAFLAIRHDVEAAIEVGYPVKTIWSNMHELGRVHFGYETFLNFTRRYIRRPSSKKLENNKLSAQIESEMTESKLSKNNTNKHKKTKSALPGFHYNSTPNKEDLF